MLFRSEDERAATEGHPRNGLWYVVGRLAIGRTISIKARRSFLLALLGVLLALAGGGLVGGFFFLGLALGLEGGLLLLHDFLVLLDGFGVHLDGGVAKSAIVSIPVLGHEGAGAAGGTGLALLGDVALAWISGEVPSTA